MKIFFYLYCGLKIYDWISLLIMSSKGFGASPRPFLLKKIFIILLAFCTLIVLPLYKLNIII
jgi:hypothetical protein